MKDFQDKDLVWFNDNLDNDEERLQLIEILLASSPGNESLQRAHKAMLSKLADNLLLGSEED